MTEIKDRGGKHMDAGDFEVDKQLLAVEESLRRKNAEIEARRRESEMRIAAATASATAAAAQRGSHSTARPTAHSGPPLPPASSSLRSDFSDGSFEGDADDSSGVASAITAAAAAAAAKRSQADLAAHADGLSPTPLTRIPKPKPKPAPSGVAAPKVPACAPQASCALVSDVSLSRALPLRRAPGLSVWSTSTRFENRVARR
jgi:hypothetical protein